MKKLFCSALLAVALLAYANSFGQKVSGTPAIYKEAEAMLRKQVLEEASWALLQQPVTVTASFSPKSAGGRHDFFSQADYFWPNPQNPNGAYINKDGETNPDNFPDHRRAMVRLSRIIGALASAYKITGDDKYVKHAVTHLKAWFVDPETLMNPNLLYAQAVIGQTTGRSWGIIDTIHFMEVAQGMIVLEKSKAFDPTAAAGIKKWFSNYLLWLNTSKPGIAEKTAKNNHSTCWIMQAASFAKLVGNKELLDSFRIIYKKTLLPDQMGTDGSFPQELTRTKPYGYSLFNLDAMAAICQILSTPQDNLWAYQTADGKSIKKGIKYLYPYVADKGKWTLKPDIMYWDNWPVAQPFLIFGANAFDNKQWLDTWKKLDHNPQVEEVIRNLPMRNPLIWM